MPRAHEYGTKSPVSVAPVVGSVPLPTIATQSMYVHCVFAPLVVRATLL